MFVSQKPCSKGRVRDDGSCHSTPKNINYLRISYSLVSFIAILLLILLKHVSCRETSYKKFITPVFVKK